MGEDLYSHVSYRNNSIPMSAYLTIPYITNFAFTLLIQEMQFVFKGTLKISFFYRDFGVPGDSRDKLGKQWETTVFSGACISTYDCVIEIGRYF